ncbi:ribosomal large subunit pseudouridine synthase D [Agarivorans sp. Toyoura001]|uniref:23S rRNA pseudouridine(1911/1915/1917) synthase RluD n=1 Tax=Agarivorans sp. Toyoura001 TaxID=2283141 RepID=UPI0010DE46F9|nr:23S rRNA pseudouridine(1911/1915/1917) synthase RluD [Agarivorans sp. Toyoura001]GDY27804.1 ribosomal large subunit pseudouridine synthase D [Agarivorans sp. Toyoura001]
MSQQLELRAIVDEELAGARLDQALATLFPDYSRSRIKEWILGECVRLDGELKVKPREKVVGGEEIVLNTVLEDVVEAKAEDIKLDIVYEDDDILVINKPINMVVHPGAGNNSGTVLNALLHLYPSIAEVARAGIVHRLDKDTSGLMVVAKTVPAQTHLVDALQKRLVTREYEAIATGTMTAGGLVEEPIGRHPTKRTHMAVVTSGKPAVTHYRVAEKFRQHTRIRLRLETGRTHQIRVHMAHIGHSLLGDQTYGRLRLPKGSSEELIAAMRGFQRQALHAVMLRLEHPITGEMMEWHAPVPQDMLDIADALRADHKLNPDLG